MQKTKYRNKHFKIRQWLIKTVVNELLKMFISLDINNENWRQLNKYAVEINISIWFYSTQLFQYISVFGIFSLHIFMEILTVFYSSDIKKKIVNHLNLYIFLISNSTYRYKNICLVTRDYMVIKMEEIVCHSLTLAKSLLVISNHFKRS